jgi:hypothetical protein
LALKAILIPRGILRTRMTFSQGEHFERHQYLLGILMVSEFVEFETPAMLLRVPYFPYYT